MNDPRILVWAYDEYGYRIELRDPRREELIVEVYEAGNSALCSQTWLPLDHRLALPLDTIAKYARQTVAEWSMDLGLPPEAIVYDKYLIDTEERAILYEEDPDAP